MTRNSYIFKLTCILLLGLSAQACQTAGSNNVLIAKHDVVVTVDGREPQKLAANEKMPLDPEKPALVESPGYLSALVVPINNRNSEWTLSLRKWQDWGGPQYDQAINAVSNEIISSVIEIQILLPSRKYEDALQKLDKLQSKYPNVTYLNFLRASCYVVKGDLDKARAALNLALKDFPNDVNGLALKKQLIDGRTSQ